MMDKLEKILKYFKETNPLEVLHSLKINTEESKKIVFSGLNNCCIKHDKKHGKISDPSWGC
jgi:hypothetical protein